MQEILKLIQLSNDDLKLTVVISFALIIVLITINIYLLFSSKEEKSKKIPVVINNKIKKNESKVVDITDCNEIENLVQYKDGKIVMCRCWKSDTFPYCNGAHVKHNKETGDNIGPLIIKK